jgi:hypothetical protein
MPRMTISITDEQDEQLDDLSGNGAPYTSKAEAVRAFLDGREFGGEGGALISPSGDEVGRSGETPGEDGELLAELRAANEELEQENERLHRERRQLLEQREENQELVRYVEDERTWRDQGLLTRTKWWLFGRSRD